MNETDAGDYAIGEAHAPKAAAKKPVASGQVGPVFGVPAKLEPFALLAKNARGASAAGLIGQATGATGVYVFSELLEIPGIKDLATNEQYAASYQLLELFAYGTWSDYAAKRDIFPALTKAQETKLKHLTILTLATENRIISYSLLLSSLELPSIPALEDLLIDAFYSNVLTGRLDQKEARLEVISGVGRDVRPLPPPASDAMEVDTTAAAPAESSVAHSVPSLTASLTLWLSTIGTLLSSLDRHLAKIAADAVNDATAKSEQERAVLDMVNTVSTSTKEGKDKGGNTLGGGGGGGGGSTSWTRDMASGILGKLTGGGGGGSKGEDMDVDAGGSTASGRGVKSPSGVGGRTRKRGRM